MYDTVKSFIVACQEESGNMCGTPVVKIMQSAKCNYSDITPILRQLYEEKFITVRKGVNDKLIFLKTARTK
jgi:hypothetical protein